jgi:Sulfotransferase family
MTTMRNFASIIFTVILICCISMTSMVSFTDVSGWRWSWSNVAIVSDDPMTYTTNSSVDVRVNVPPFFAKTENWSEYREELYDPFWRVVSPKLNLAVTIIPKVMCSSIRAALDTIECGSLRNRCAEDSKRSPQGRAEQMYHYNMTRVIFLRDPFERILSTYYNSDTNPYILLPNCQSWRDPGCGIDAWVHYIYRNQRRAFQNEHFLPQASVAQFHKMHYNYILRMTSKTDQAFFWANLAKTKPFGINQSTNSKSTSPNATQALSLREKVKQKFSSIPDHTIIQMVTVYKKDFRLWEMAITTGSKKDPTVEYTMYDYYKEVLEPELRQKYPLEYYRSQL